MPRPALPARLRRLPATLLTLLLVPLPGCSGDKAPPSAGAPAHHTAEGFRNRDGSTIDKSQWEV